MPLNNLDKYSEVFVETGTLSGAGITAALQSGYTKVISIELDEKLYNQAKNNFANISNVELVCGDSGIVLGDSIKDIDENITFWLDGHYSGEGTAYGIAEFPLIQELTHIKNHHIKTHTILIDDIRCWRDYSPELNFEKVIEFVLSINENYSFYYAEGYIKDDVLVCKVD